MYSASKLNKQGDNMQPSLTPVQFWTSQSFHVSSNYCFLTCIQISQEAGQVVWYPHLFKNFPKLVVIHTVKGFSVASEAEVDVFLKFYCFLCDPENLLLIWSLF